MRLRCVAASGAALIALCAAPALGQPAPGCTPFGTTLATASAFSPDAQVELARRDEALAQLEGLRALGRPQLSAFGRSLAGDDGLSDAQIANQVGLRLSQDLFDFSKRRLQERAAEHDLAGAASDVEAAREATALQAGVTYLEALRADEQAAALRSEREFLGLLAQTLSDLEETRAATADEVFESKARLAAADAQIEQLGLLKEQAVIVLRLLTGIETLTPCPAPNLDDELRRGYEEIAASEAALRQAIADHPRVQAAAKAVDARAAEQSYEKRSWLPTVRGVGTFAYGQGDSEEAWRTRDSLGVEFSMPLFSSGNQTARERAASAREAQARNARTLAAIEIERQVRLARQSYALGELQLSRRQLAVEQKRGQFALLQQAYRDGVRTLRELVEVQSELTANELAAIANKFDVREAGLTLNVLTGQLRKIPTQPAR